MVEGSESENKHRRNRRLPLRLSRIRPAMSCWSRSVGVLNYKCGRNLAHGPVTAVAVLALHACALIFLLGHQARRPRCERGPKLCAPKSERADEVTRCRYDVLALDLLHRQQRPNEPSPPQARWEERVVTLAPAACRRARRSWRVYELGPRRRWSRRAGSGSRRPRSCCDDGADGKLSSGSPLSSQE